jgi:LmbE family N-acetylglucosaminyl deacetylase
MHRSRGIALLVLLASSVLAQGEHERDVPFQQALLDISHDGVLMNISAHPDDEDGASLAYYRMKYGVKTYSILFTRGEGGQNEKGPELYEELGVLRSQETEAAGRILGAEVHFLNFSDFGYSKTASEAFRMWGGQTEVLRRLVYAIRKYKPDILFSNHNTIDGHGHHQAVAIAAIAAFDAAADSTYFPEQLREEGVRVWQPRKLFFRAFGRAESTADVVNPVDDTSAIRGMTYLDVASNALRMHRTQGLDRVNLRSFARGRSLYKLIRTNSLYDQDSTTFFSGINLFHDPSVSRLLPVRRNLDRLRPDMPRDSILMILSGMFSAADSLRKLPDASSLTRRMISHWEEEGGTLAAAACGAELRCRFSDSIAVRKQTVTCSVHTTARSCELAGARWKFQLPRGWSLRESSGMAPVVSRHGDERSYEITVGDAAQFTLPRVRTQYQSLERREEILVILEAELNGHRIAFSLHPVLEIAPMESIEPEPRTLALLRSRLGEGVSIGYAIQNSLPHKTAGRIGFRAPAGWSADSEPFIIAREDSVARGRLSLRPPNGIAPGDYMVHLRTELASEPVTVRVVDANVAPGVRLAIVKSYDTTLELAAGMLGIHPAMLSDEDLRTADLSRYTTIIIDIRAYLVREGLRANNGRLLAYVRNGGNLVVMYQREAEWKPEYAPFPFQVSRKRVCDEEAPISILRPAHPLMTSPNRIGDADWAGWKQERGVYFPVAVSGEYDRLLSSADPDEPPLDTGYLVASSGAGSYVYTTYVWYRELKEGNGGAFRCFANMISYPAFRKAMP